MRKSTPVWFSLFITSLWVIQSHDGGRTVQQIVGLWWPWHRLGGLFQALPLTFPCRCWDFWPLHRAVPCCLWVLLIVMEWSSQHVYVQSVCTFIVYKCVLVCFKCMTLCVCVCVDSVGPTKPSGLCAGNSIWHEHSEDYLCPDSYCLTDNKNRHHSLFKVNVLKQGASLGRK